MFTKSINIFECANLSTHPFTRISLASFLNEYICSFMCTEVHFHNIVGHFFVKWGKSAILKWVKCLRGPLAHRGSVRAKFPHFPHCLPLNVSWVKGHLFETKMEGKSNKGLFSQLPDRKVSPTTINSHRNMTILG